MKIIKGVLTFNTSNDFIKYSSYKKRNIKVYIYEKIKVAFDLNIKQVCLFNISSSNLLIKVNEKNWIKPLEKCLSYFEEVEDYLLCNECIKMIELIKNKASI